MARGQAGGTEAPGPATCLRSPSIASLSCHIGGLLEGWGEWGHGSCSSSWTPSDNHLDLNFFFHKTVR